jgi:hypothetical protein
MSNTRSQYIFFRRVGQALAPFQLLEAFLKIYIGRVHLRIKGILDGKVPFHSTLGIRKRTIGTVGYDVPTSLEQQSTHQATARRD